MYLKVKIQEMTLYTKFLKIKYVILVSVKTFFQHCTQFMLCCMP